ncbi:hypothetical protein EJ110_NYTH33024 [Nymphaea thermarum]|nr:hypothetical protein EJ110_NYTH33024 [Nymphaea thermarum]
MAPRKAKTIEPEPVGIEGEQARVEETRLMERGEPSATTNKLDLILTQLAGVSHTITHMDNRLNALEQRKDPPRSHTSSYYRRNAPIGMVSEAFLGDARRASLGGLGVVGKINNQKVVVLLDSGATHNFLHSRLAHLVEGKVIPQASFSVMVGNGEKMTCSAVCKNVCLEMQKTPFDMDLYLLPIGGVDVVLGIQWMKPLKKTLYDWENMTFSFPKEGGGEIILEAINPSVDPKPALKALIGNQPAYWLVSMVGAASGVEEDLREANEASRVEDLDTTRLEIEGPSAPCLEKEDPNSPSSDEEDLGAMDLDDGGLGLERNVPKPVPDDSLGVSGRAISCWKALGVRYVVVNFQIDRRCARQSNPPRKSAALATAAQAQPPQGDRGSFDRITFVCNFCPPEVLIVGFHGAGPEFRLKFRAVPACSGQIRVLGN